MENFLNLLGSFKKKSQNTPGGSELGVYSGRGFAPPQEKNFKPKKEDVSLISSMCDLKRIFELTYYDRIL